MYMPICLQGTFQPPHHVYMISHVVNARSVSAKMPIPSLSRTAIILLLLLFVCFCFCVCVCVCFMPSGVYVPVGGKKLLTFMDDFNMPAKDTFGSQPPLELVKQWIDYGFWYDRQKQTVKQIKVGHIPRYTLQYREREQLYCLINVP